jgi:serine/threonine protein kinase
MSFDLIETTVANAILLRASFDLEPVDLTLPEFAELKDYEAEAKAAFQVDQVLQEPLGNYQFQMFLRKSNAQHRIGVYTEILEFKTRKPQGRSSKCKYIFSKYLKKAISRPEKLLDPLTNLPLRPPLAAKVAEQVFLDSPAALSDKDVGRHESIEVSPVLHHSSESTLPVDDLDTVFDNSGTPHTSLSATSEAAVEIKERAAYKNALMVKRGSRAPSPAHTPAVSAFTGSSEVITEEVRAEKPDSVPLEDTKDIELVKENFGQSAKEMAQIIHEVEDEEDDDDSAYGEDNSDDRIYDLGIPETAILKAWQSIVIAHSCQKAPSSTTFDEIFEIVRDQLELDSKEFMESEEFKLYLQLKFYCETKTIGFDDFQLFRVLGKGAFGAVHAVRKKDTKRIYAMKEMEKRKVKYYQSEKMCLTEKNVLQKLSSPFALSLKYSFTSEEALYLVFDICQGGDLQYHLAESESHKFTESRTKLYCAELVLALEHLHSLDFVYRDLKPGNVLLDDKGHVMLSDLGLVHRLSKHKELRNLAGTAGYWAPEVMKRENQTKAVDWWTLGVFMHKLLTGKRPDCICAKKAKEWCPFGTTDDHEQNAKMGLPMRFFLDISADGLSPEAIDIMKRLMTPEVAARLGFHGADEVKAHPWFADIDWDRVEHREIKAPYIPRKGEVNAASLGEIGEGDPNAHKYRKIELNEDDKNFYDRFYYKSVTAFQEEMVWALKRNRRVKYKQVQREQRKAAKGVQEKAGGCCSLQ